MIRLIYASTALSAWGTEDLLKLLKECRAHNSAKNITGILLFSNNTFLQVLEGDEASVNSMYALIEKDPRHTDVTIIEKQPIVERAFPYWSMGFESVDSNQLTAIPGFNDFFAQDFTPSGLAAHKYVIAPLLSHLRAKLISQVGPSVSHEELPMQHEDPFIQLLHRTIRIGVKFLALLMVVVILFGIVDVVYVMYQKIVEPPMLLLSINDMLETFGAFLAVLIAIEIFLNITLYIRSDVIPVKLVVATALMAISRKVIVFDYKSLSSEYVSASALVLVALGVTYWLIQNKE
ncbi:MAG: phosphate-starvation-inducible PsiE family protein [Methylococcaceae bacterium]|nr:phosphate-starvation-inducible PsiE family protein [Methylococcaceae bacterium]MDZ4155796.1 phosphate-starvation-inducible PsiE family protein [Methylococcales bacterium]MDP2391855.1 phosphate-starvation-inducible PsiE family protein [Methylococcaceae bacterium]MDP3018906.1 phosphate-starvation-inducible PsiE family protein [Methylococcaceae bacterium]MDP3391467.1 phosphate-starvation-inducible PsiE family protein [Methylococcaceae bacterium]